MSVVLGDSVVVVPVVAEPSIVVALESSPSLPQAAVTTAAVSRMATHRYLIGEACLIPEVRCCHRPRLVVCGKLDWTIPLGNAVVRRWVHQLGAVSRPKSGIPSPSTTGMREMVSSSIRPSSKNAVTRRPPSM